MENQSPWKWHIDKEFADGKVAATISSSDNKSEFKLTGVPGRMVDSIVSLLISSYKWGHQDGTTSLQKEIKLDDK